MKQEIRKTTDPNTGEIISKVSIPDVYKKELDKLIGEHQIIMNNFVMLSQQKASIEVQWMNQFAAIGKSDKAIREKMQFFCKKSGLDKNEPWTYNMNEKVFELKEPPPLAPLTGSGVPLGAQ